jgi:Polypeptide deformylase
MNSDTMVTTRMLGSRDPPGMDEPAHGAAVSAPKAASAQCAGWSVWAGATAAGRRHVRGYVQVSSKRIPDRPFSTNYAGHSSNTSSVWPLCHQPCFADVLAAGVPDRDDGVGLAAPQVGVSVRLMVFNAAGERGQGEELVLANPRIISSSRKQELGEEGCLSFLKLNSRELILADVEV